MEAYRLEDNSLVRVDFDEALSAITELLKKRTLIFFFGAGVSLEYPSLLPLTRKSNRLPGLKELLEEILLEEIPLERDRERELVIREVKRLALESMLDFFSSMLGDEALEFYDVLKRRNLAERYGPNYRHYFLVSLAQSGCCKRFVTVNFDTLVEDAFKARGVSLTIPEEKRQREEENIYSNAVKSPNDLNCLFKLHGTLRDQEDPQNTSLLATVERVGIGLPQHKKRFLASLSRTCDIFFMGYSDNDIDVFPVLEATVPRRNVFWYSVSIPRPSDPGFRPIREFLLRREHCILVGDLSRILGAILERMNLDPSEALINIDVSCFENIERREKALAKTRKMEIDEFVSRYKIKFLPTRAHTVLVLANIIVNAGFYDIGKKLLRSVERAIPTGGSRLGYMYDSLRSEISRNEGQYIAAIGLRADERGLDETATVL